MKTLTTVIILLIISYISFAQRVINEKIDVRYVQLPLTVMPDVKTYNCVWNKDSIKENLPEIETQFGYNDMMIKGCMAIQGLTYNKTNPDITVTLQSSAFELIDPIIVNLKEGQENANYRIKFDFPMDWKIIISGKYEAEIVLNPSKNITVYMPALNEKYLGSEIILTPYNLSANLDLKRDEIYKIAISRFLSEALQIVENKIKNELAYVSKVKEVEIESFKTTKKEDMTEWDKPYERGRELLTKISSGESPNKLYSDYKDVFSFWDEQLLSYKVDEKENKKFIKVGFHNLINTLELVNPAAIKDEYFEIYSNIDKYEVKKIEKRIIDAQERQIANKDNSLDYHVLSKLIPLIRGYKYEVLYTNNKDEKKQGLIYFGFNSMYGFNPYQTGTGFNIFDEDISLERNGNVFEKHEVDIKKVESYELLGEKYVKIKFSDPTSISMGMNEFFLQELYSGNVSLYKHWKMEHTEGHIGDVELLTNTDPIIKSRKNPVYVLDLGKKKTVVYNYKKLTKLFDDCQAVVDKINSGAYGNPPINTETSKIGNMLQNALGSDFNEEILIAIITDYNATMQ